MQKTNQRRWCGWVSLCICVSLLTGGMVQAASTQPAAEAPQLSFDQAIVIPIKTEISDITFDSVQRRMDRAREEQIDLVIFELDTPGGSLPATLKICNAIKRARDNGMKTYAWVNSEAYSAGTIIALATDGIVMAHNATMGDCQPITVTGSGAAAIPEDLEAKAVSPLLEELRDSVRRNGYNLDLVMSLVRPQMQVFWVVNGDTGEREFVDAAKRNELFGWSDRRTGLLGLFGGETKHDEPLPDSLSKTAWHYVREDPVLGQIEQPVVNDRELLTMRDQRAKAFGFSQATIDNDSQMRDYLHISGALQYTELTFMERAVEWLASPAVRAVLFMLMLLGAYTEMHAPGVSLPGAVAVVALMLFLGAPYMAGFTVTWEIAVIVLGVVLLAIELFLIPGFGFVGIAGLILLGFGLLSSFAPPEPMRPHFWQLPELPGTYTYLRNGAISLSAGLAGAATGMVALGRYLPRAPIVSAIIGRNPTREEVCPDDPYPGVAKVGDVGQSETLLRPAGKARFGATLVDVVSEGEYVPSGEQIEVIERCGNRVVVRRTA